MKRLRQPIRAIREPFGKAGLIVACLALVFAMAGGAFAAKGGLTKKESREVAKIAKKEAKKYAGKNGKNGTNGANGANGAKGDTGARGATGPQGPAGPQGPQGVQGPQGPTGATGSPWTAGGVLPSGKTETGTYAMGLNTAPVTYGAISFPIPLAEIPSSEVIPMPPVGEPTASTENCPGTASDPSAEPGFLCVYVVEGEVPPEVGLFSATGASLFHIGAGFVSRGSFAVTAE
ncbi:MAG TPA: hypothetical protein VHE08_07280 [Solirubrobacterales bacterium]|nr:hypothetical protein [Solirubrobacterales bacterium]